MTSVLSQDEIDELLTAISAGNTEPDKLRLVMKTRYAKIYDFKRPDKFSKEQIRTIAMMHETFARLTATSLSARLRSIVHVHVASVDQLTYEEFIRSIPTPTTLAIINMDPLKGNAILEIDPAITFSIIDRLFGGTGEGAKNPHELTNIEQSVMEDIIVRTLGNMRKAWIQATDLRPCLTHIDTNPQFTQIVPPTDMVVLVTLEARIGDIEGMINICYPYSTLSTVMDRLNYSLWFGDMPSCSKKKELSGRADIPVKLTAEILRRNYPIREICEWKQETLLLPLRPSSHDCCWLRLGDRRVWQCRIMEDHKWFPKNIEITGITEMPYETEGKVETAKANSIVADALSMAGITISVELGSTAKTVKEILAMGEGTIVELDKLAGEPVDVKANGVLIAKGEVVVIDENFGVRLTEVAESTDLFQRAAEHA